MKKFSWLIEYGDRNGFKFFQSEQITRELASYDFVSMYFRTKNECGTRLDKVCSSIKKWMCDKPKPEPEPEPETEPHRRLVRDEKENLKIYVG